jgi:uncharacterized LabA/DUF88 family protein
MVSLTASQVFAYSPESENPTCDRSVAPPVEASLRTAPGAINRFGRAQNKGVDSAIVTDLLSLAWENAYEVAILVSSDADFVPAVERLQEKGFKVINGTWKGHGHQLARVYWASFEIDGLTSTLIRKA